MGSAALSESLGFLGQRYMPFALMYSSGITVLECLKVAEDIAGNRAVEEALRATSARAPG